MFRFPHSVSFASFRFPSPSLVSFRFFPPFSIPFVSFDPFHFRLVPFVSPLSLSFHFVSFRSISFHFVSLRFLLLPFVSLRLLTFPFRSFPSRSAPFRPFLFLPLPFLPLDSFTFVSFRFLPVPIPLSFPFAPFLLPYLPFPANGPPPPATTQVNLPEPKYGDTAHMPDHGAEGEYLDLSVSCGLRPYRPHTVSKRSHRYTPRIASFSARKRFARRLRPIRGNCRLLVESLRFCTLRIYGWRRGALLPTHLWSDYIENGTRRLKRLISGVTAGEVRFPFDATAARRPRRPGEEPLASPERIWFDRYRQLINDVCIFTKCNQPGYVVEVVLDSQLYDIARRARVNLRRGQKIGPRSLEPAGRRPCARGVRLFRSP